MDTTHTLRGTIVYQNIEFGFWGIIGSDGNEYLPINLPDRLKSEGKEIFIEFQEAKNAMSVLMWGTPIEIVSILKN